MINFNEVLTFRIRSEFDKIIKKERQAYQKLAGSEFDTICQVLSLRYCFYMHGGCIWHAKDSIYMD